MERWRAYRQPRVYYRTEPKLSGRKKLRFSGRAGRRFLIVIMLGMTAWILFWSPVFAIREVILTGETTEQLEQARDLLRGRNLVTLSEKQVFDELTTAEPSLASLRLTRGFPHQLQIHFSRRHPALIWVQGETRWSIDAKGIAFAYDPVTADGKPPVIDRRAQPVSHGQKIVSPDFVTFVTQGSLEIPPVIGGRLLYGEISDTTLHLKFVTEWGWAILLDTSRPLAGQLASLNLILKDRREAIQEYVDLRLAGRAYLK